MQSLNILSLTDSRLEALAITKYRNETCFHFQYKQYFDKAEVIYA